jgi:hypothetical protein
MLWDWSICKYYCIYGFSKKSDRIICLARLILNLENQSLLLSYDLAATPTFLVC